MQNTTCENVTTMILPSTNVQRPYNISIRIENNANAGEDNKTFDVILQSDNLESLKVGNRSVATVIIMDDDGKIVFIYLLHSVWVFCMHNVRRVAEFAVLFST